MGQRREGRRWRRGVAEIKLARSAKARPCKSCQDFNLCPKDKEKPLKAFKRRGDSLLSFLERSLSLCDWRGLRVRRQSRCSGYRWAMMALELGDGVEAGGVVGLSLGAR